MGKEISVRLYRDGNLLTATTVEGEAELGRRREGEEAALGATIQGEGGARIVIAERDEAGVSRGHARLEAVDDAWLRVVNASATEPIGLDQGRTIGAGEELTITLPCRMQIGPVVVRVDAAGNVEGRWERLPAATAAPLARGDVAKSQIANLVGDDAHDAVDAETLFRWLYAALDVVQSAATRDDFFGRAAEAVVEVGGLDYGAVVAWDAESRTWSAEAEAVGRGERWEPSRQVLAELVHGQRTIWMSPGAEAVGSLQAVEAVVGAPILNRAGTLVAALYGARGARGGEAKPPSIQQVEATVVELLASGVAAGLARMDEQRAAMEMRVRFEQFFSAELAEELEREPRLLDGRNEEVTVLFADVRGFSRISERVGAARTVEWIRDVMGGLSACVLAESGVVVDYIGDELMAMWGAPRRQADQATKACRAAAAMIERLEEIDTTWSATVGEATRLTIGICGGTALVGNVGSAWKFKYGPIGTTVNLASRVQGIAKFLGVDVAMTERTKRESESEFTARRLCRVQVVNIEQPIDVYEPMARGGEKEALVCRYEAALDAFEAGNVEACLGELEALERAGFGNDGPRIWLARRCDEVARSGMDAWSPVWTAPGK